MLAILYDPEINISVLTSGYQQLSSFSRNGLDFITVSINGKRVLFGQIGYTKNINSSTLEFLTNQLGVSKLILTGNTASYGGTISDIAVSTSAFQYDVDFQPIGYAEFELPGIPQYIFEADPSLVALASTVAANLEYGFSRGAFASADMFMADDAKIAALNTDFGVSFVDTETANVGEISYLYNIPFVSVKGISNHGGAGAAAEYEANKIKADIDSVKVAIAMAQSLTLLADPKCLDYSELNQCQCRNVLEIVGNGVLCTCSNQIPYGVPVNYTVRNNNGSFTLILHSDLTGLKIRNIRANRNVCFTVLYTEGTVCRSVVIIGTARIFRGSSDCCYDATIEITPICVRGREFFFPA